MVNLRQAGYKPLKISGKIRSTPGGSIFLGQAAPVMEREMVVGKAGGVLVTRHSRDMKILDCCTVLEDVTGHRLQAVLGLSFFQLIHGQDCQAVLEAFSKCKY